MAPEAVAYFYIACNILVRCMGAKDELIERGVREHPELSVGSNTDGIDVRSVGNSQVLQARIKSVIR